VAAIALLLIFLGCMNIEIGKFGSSSSGTTESDGTFCQEGEATIAPGVIREVYYPVPYGHPPNLEVGDTFHYCQLVSERENSFSVRNDSTHSVTVSWKARGLKAPGPPTESVLPPPAPVPVEVPESTGKAR